MFGNDSQGGDILPFMQGKWKKTIYWDMKTHLYTYKCDR